jgi:hypothetical protein
VEGRIKEPQLVDANAPAKTGVSGGRPLLTVQRLSLLRLSAGLFKGEFPARKV